MNVSLGMVGAAETSGALALMNRGIVHDRLSVARCQLPSRNSQLTSLYGELEDNLAWLLRGSTWIVPGVHQLICPSSEKVRP
jgi:hypothetical protein